jgi:hypothetical protein
MPRTRINCPNCRQPIIADIDQLFDVGQDQTAKQKFLSGMFNVAQCQSCGYQGLLATPIVYHDPAKELLLSYFPAELNLPVNEQEKLIGPLITQVTNSLPQEKRKAYLFSPRTMLTLQSMIETVLEADGITKEMLAAQQKKLSLIQQLASAKSVEAMQEIARAEDANIDADFFTILSRLIEASLGGGDEASARRLGEVQQVLLQSTSFGKQVAEQTKEVEAAIQSLQAAGDKITRDELLDLISNAPNDLQLSVLVSMARPGMDYEFFTRLSARIEKAQGEEKERLSKLCERLLEMTNAMDQQAEVRMTQSRQLLEGLLQAADMRQAMAQVLPAIDEFFLKAVEEELQTARKMGDLERSAKLSQISQLLEEASAPPPEFALIQEMLEAPDEEGVRKLMSEHKEEITPEFVELLTQLVTRQQPQDAELSARLQMIYSQAVRMSMQANL